MLNQLYDQHDYDFEPRHGKENEKYDGVLIHRKTNHRFSIEEKGLSYVHTHCPIELIQDIKTMNLGWFYKTEANSIVFIYFHANTTNPAIVYIARTIRLKNYNPDYFLVKNVFTAKATNGYGDTVNLNIPWELFLEDGTARIWNEWE